MLEDEISLALEAGDIYIASEYVTQKLRLDLKYKRLNSIDKILARYSNLISENELFYFSFCSSVLSYDDKSLKELLSRICRYKSGKEIVKKETLIKALLFLSQREKLSGFQKSVSYLLSLIVPNSGNMSVLRILEIIVIFKEDIFILLEVGKQVKGSLKDSLSRYIFKSKNFDYSLLSNRHPYAKTIFNENKKSISTVDNSYPDQINKKDRKIVYDLEPISDELSSAGRETHAKTIIDVPFVLKADLKEAIKINKEEFTSYFELLKSMELYDFAIDLIHEFDIPNATEKKQLAYYHEYFSKRKKK